MVFICIAGNTSVDHVLCLTKRCVQFSKIGFLSITLAPIYFLSYSHTLTSCNICLLHFFASLFPFDLNLKAFLTILNYYHTFVMYVQPIILILLFLWIWQYHTIPTVHGYISFSIIHLCLVQKFAWE